MYFILEKIYNLKMQVHVPVHVIYQSLMSKSLKLDKGKINHMMNIMACMHKYIKLQILFFKKKICLIKKILSISEEVGFIHWILWNHHCGGPIFMAFLGNPCKWINTPTNIYTNICLLQIKTIPNFLPTKLLSMSQRTRKSLAAHEHWLPGIKMIPQ